MKKNIITLALILLVFSCDKKLDCNQDIACTEVFVSVTIEIINSNGNSYVLDSYKTIKKSSKEVFVLNDDISNDKFYVVLNDLYKKNTTIDGEIFVFEGVKDNVVVVSEEFVISADCCHIKLVSGKTKIVIE